MPMHNLTEYSDNYSKTSGSLWKYCKDIPAVINNGKIVNFAVNNPTDSFNFKAKMTVQTGDDTKKDVEIMVPLKYLSNFWRTLEMPLINCEINLFLTWSENCVIPSIFSWNKCLSKPELLTLNPNLNHLVEPSFQGVNRLFVLAFENDTLRTSTKSYYLPDVELNVYNIVVDGKNFFDQPIRDNKVTYENIRKIATGQGDDYTTGGLLDYPYFKDNYQVIAVNLSKQQALDADARAIQQANFTANLDRADNTRIFVILEEAKETILYFSQGTVKVL